MGAESVPHRDVTARVVAVVHHPWPYFTVRALAPPEFGEAAPGQFVMTLAELTLEPYLRRAFSVFDQRRLSEGEHAGSIEVEIFGKVIGPGTDGLARLVPGAEIPLLGPLGRGFERVEAQPQRAALVAGGIGSAALLLWARALAAAGDTVDFFYGGRAAVDLALADRFEAPCQASGGEVIVATENGERGHRGLITEPLEQALSDGRYGAVYTCGPEGLMARVASLCEHYGVAGQAALETEMGCGYGACLGCAVPTGTGRYLLCCKDGPAFDFGQVAW